MWADLQSISTRIQGFLRVLRFFPCQKPTPVSMWYDLEGHKFNSRWQFSATLSKWSDLPTSDFHLREAEEKHIKHILTRILGNPWAVSRDGTKKSQPKSGPVRVYKWADTRNQGEIWDQESSSWPRLAWTCKSSLVPFLPAISSSRPA